jgi:hypothetical protein
MKIVCNKATLVLCSKGAARAPAESTIFLSK